MPHIGDYRSNQVASITIEWLARRLAMRDDKQQSRDHTDTKQCPTEHLAKRSFKDDAAKVAMFGVKSCLGQFETSSMLSCSTRIVAACAVACSKRKRFLCLIKTAK